MIPGKRDAVDSLRALFTFLTNQQNLGIEIWVSDT